MTDDRLQRAAAAYRDEDHDTAERLLREILDSTPQAQAALWLSRLLWWVRGDGAAGSAILIAHFRDIFDVRETSGAALVPREIAAVHATGTVLAESLRCHGAVLLRGLYDAASLARFPTDDLLPDVEKPVLRLTEVPDDLIEPLIVPMIAETVEAIGLRLDNWRESSWIRRVDPTLPDSIVPFHQDSLVCQMRCANLWIPLADCGPSTGKPGLELVARPLTSLRPTTGGDETEYARNFMEIDEAGIARDFAADDLWAPDFRLGDALMFLGTTIHRSALFAEQVQPRTSIELRFRDAL